MAVLCQVAPVTTQPPSGVDPLPAVVISSQPFGASCAKPIRTSSVSFCPAVRSKVPSANSAAPVSRLSGRNEAGRHWPSPPRTSTVTLESSNWTNSAPKARVGT